MVNATKEVFISETHQKAMAAEGEDMESVDTRLTKNGAPTPLKKGGGDNISCLAGETRESKS